MFDLVFCDASKEKERRNGTASGLVDPPTTGKVFNHHNNVHYTLGDFLSSRASGSISKGTSKRFVDSAHPSFDFELRDAREF